MNLYHLQRIEYLEVVQNDFVTSEVLKFQKSVASFDIKKLLNYDNFSKYEVLFRTNKGNIQTFYKGEGEIFWSRAKYRGVKLPISIVKKIMREYEGCKIGDNRYLTIYHGCSKTTQNLYSIYLNNGTASKKVKLNLDYTPES